MTNTKKFDLRTASLDELRRKIKELQDDIATVEIDGERVDLRRPVSKNSKGGSISIGKFKGTF